MTKLINVVTFVVIAITLYSPTLKASNLPDFPFVLATGEAKVNVAPNMAHISLNLMAFNSDPEAALMTVGLRGREVVQLLNERQVLNADIKSFALNKQIKRERTNGYGQGKISGYEVNQRFEVTLKNIDHYSLVMDKLIAMKNVNNVNISFDVTNRQALIRSLVKSAGQDAKQKAQDLAAGLDVQLGSVFAATQDNSFNEFFARFGMRQENMGHVESMRMSDRAGNYNMFVPETIELRKTINVVYKLK